MAHKDDLAWMLENVDLGYLNETPLGDKAFVPPSDDKGGESPIAVEGSVVSIPRGVAGGGLVAYTSPEWEANIGGNAFRVGDSKGASLTHLGLSKGIADGLRLGAQYKNAPESALSDVAREWVPDLEDRLPGRRPSESFMLGLKRRF